jgi:hypothetical protein
MWKLTAAMALVPLLALTGQATGPDEQPVKAEAVEFAQLNTLDSLDNMDMIKARAMQNHAISTQTLAFVAAR